MLCTNPDRFHTKPSDELAAAQKENVRLLKTVLDLRDENFALRFERDVFRAGFVLLNVLALGYILIVVLSR